MPSRGAQPTSHVERSRRVVVSSIPTDPLIVHQDRARWPSRTLEGGEVDELDMGYLCGDLARSVFRRSKVRSWMVPLEEPGVWKNAGCVSMTTVAPMSVNSFRRLVILVVSTAVHCREPGTTTCCCVPVPTSSASRSHELAHTTTFWTPPAECLLLCLLDVPWTRLGLRGPQPGHRRHQGRVDRSRRRTR